MFNFFKKKDQDNQEQPPAAPISHSEQPDAPPVPPAEIPTPQEVDDIPKPPEMNDLPELPSFEEPQFPAIPQEEPEEQPVPQPVVSEKQTQIEPEKPAAQMPEQEPPKPLEPAALPSLDQIQGPFFIDTVRFASVTGNLSMIKRDNAQMIQYGEQIKKIEHHLDTKYDQLTKALRFMLKKTESIEKKVFKELR